MRAVKILGRLEALELIDIKKERDTFLGIVF